MCYTCNMPTPRPDCRTETNCTALSPLLQTCKTTVYATDQGYPFQGNQIIVRQCVQTCKATNQNLLGVTNPIYCCSSDFCNNMGLKPDGSNGPTAEGAAIVKLNFVAMLLPLLATAALF
ncbi:Hypothetical predicted protein [Pelobates cultripes]|uniref:Snake toxin/toxin-like domain-containing protein n=1 Tax=Pelobates cultripes TaxID=61616 RepID=A0AAD1S4B2_PELCU|nr:Hypothetical predicted protein [Pelobates cultripes]